MSERRRDSGWQSAAEAWTVLGTLFSGLLVWGGLGLVADLLLGPRWLFLPIGMVVGMGTSIYIVYLRYGRP
jgi:F0F1-type ATP synthase assembly protein I